MTGVSWRERSSLNWKGYNVVCNTVATKWIRERWGGGGGGGGVPIFVLTVFSVQRFHTQHITHFKEFLEVKN